VIRILVTFVVKIVVDVGGSEKYLTLGEDVMKFQVLPSISCYCLFASFVSYVRKVCGDQ